MRDEVNWTRRTSGGSHDAPFRAEHRRRRPARDRVGRSDWPDTEVGSGKRAFMPAVPALLSGLLCAATVSCFASCRAERSQLASDSPAEGGTVEQRDGSTGDAEQERDGSAGGTQEERNGSTGGTAGQRDGSAGGVAGTGDAAADGGHAGSDVTGDPQGARSVEDVLENADALLGQELAVTGRVFDDYRQKPGDWPAPVLSTFILQDGGDAPAYTAGGESGIPYIQLYSASVDLGPYLEQDATVTARLREVVYEDLSGESVEFLYLEVIGISRPESWGVSA